MRLRYSNYLWVVALVVTLPLHDARPDAAQLAYDHAWQLFVHGQLIQCQQEADRTAQRFRVADPKWAAKFELLTAQAMVWRGLNADALSSLAGLQTRDLNDTVQKLALEASVFTKLQRFPASDAALQQAESLCRMADYTACGTVLRARGVLAVDRGQSMLGRQFFLRDLDFSRDHRDRFLEATALLNLGWTALQSDRYDEAADWSKAAQRVALELGAEEIAQAASGNLGYAYYALGDHERALGLFLDAEKQAARLGSFRVELKWLEDIGIVYQTDGDPSRAAPVYRQALDLAKQIDSKLDIAIALEELIYAAIDAGRLEDASAYLDQLGPLTQASGNRLHQLIGLTARGKIAVQQRQDRQAEEQLLAAETDPAISISLKLEAEQDLAQLYEVEGHAPAADEMYRKALTNFESARAQLKNEDSRLPFVANAESIYDSYIHFLVHQGRAEEALAVADQSRAQTLAEGLGLSSPARSSDPKRLNASAIAQSAQTTALFYWLGKQESYLWAVTPAKVEHFALPPAKEIAAQVDRYRAFLLSGRDALSERNADARSLYEILVAPAAPFIRAGSDVAICADGVLSKLNFETLVAPGVDNASDSRREPHYWLEDATIVSAPSLSMLAAVRTPQPSANKLLIIGDSISSTPDYPELPLAGTEIRLVKQHFAPTRETVFARSAATPASYLSSNPQQYAYIHFVAHGTASQADPLESAIVLSPNLRDRESFKLYARDIIRHPLDARLVTISACYGSGARTYSGEGLVGLSWSFLRAGAHNVIGALWDVSDESTPRMMNLLYKGIQGGLPPSEALRDAKLELLHSHGEFQKPFYWAPFQLYEGR